MRRAEEASTVTTSISATDVGGVFVRELRKAQPSGRRVVDRYRVAVSSTDAVLHCDETPGIDVRIDASFTFSEAEARKLGPRVILLDGAGAFAPLIDGDAKLYNLDHHQGCVRAFTLATCEQALVLVAKGLELDRGGWTLYANEPDLDAVLAIWVLLNHRRVMQLSDAEQRILLPMIRLEGAIDACGIETAAFCGLPEPARGEAERRLDQLFQREQALRALPTLTSSARTAALLREVDGIVFAETDFGEWRPVEELFGNIELSDELVAVACRDTAGIYDVERRLRERWGARLGLIVLQRQPGKYTLRASAALAGVSLEPLYSFLNIVDPAVDGRPASQRWGGSDEIGGSPRDRRSALTPDGVLRAAHWVARRPLGRVRAALRALWTSAAVALAALLLSLGAFAISGFRTSPLTEACIPLGLAGTIALSAGTWLACRQKRKALWVPGWRAPAGRLWLLLVPLAVGLATLVGAWLPASARDDAFSGVASAATAALAVFGSEAWFRGWVHGLVWLASPSRALQQPPLVSTATLVSSALYALAMLLVVRPAHVVPTAAAAMLAGVALGTLRERSLSLWPGIAAQLLAVALTVFLLA
jgi:hypothetical protein